jgi:hypothetical protein
MTKAGIGSRESGITTLARFAIYPGKELERDSHHRSQPHFNACLKCKRYGSRDYACAFYSLLPVLYSLHLNDSHSATAASIDLDHSETAASVCNPFWPFTMLRAARGGIRRALINNLVASPTVEQSRGSRPNEEDRPYCLSAGRVRSSGPRSGEPAGYQPQWFGPR